MKKKRMFLVLMVLCLGLFILYFVNSDELKNNYYLTINKKVIEDNELDEGEYSWSYFLEAQNEVDEDTSLMVRDVLDGNVSILSEKEVSTIRKIYDKAIDMDKRDEVGIRDLKLYLDKVWNIFSVDDLVEVIILIEKELGIGLLTNIEVVSDYKDNNRNIIYFYPITYAFGASSDYMVNDDFMTYKAYVRRAIVQLWKAYGYGAKEAREIAARVFNFYEGVSSVSKLSSELEDISDYYRLVTEEEVNGLFSNVSGKYLSRRGIDGKDYSLVDKEQYKFLNDSLTSNNLEVWKEVIVTKILSSYASYGSREYKEVVDNLNEEIFGGSEEVTDGEKAENVVKSLFSSEIDRVYESKCLINSQVEDIEKMFLDIKNVFEVRIKNNEWLSDVAKDKALVKLDKMKVVVGIGGGQGYRIADGLEVSNGSLIRDVIRIQQLVMNDDLERLNSGEKRSLVSQMEVNAYYQPLSNSIAIPVAFFELVDKYDSYYEKLGTLGMIIAHEVTHAFDGNGSKFDENGNLNDWWSEEDKKVFEELRQGVIDYYGQYEVLGGKYIDGEATVNENIADLGALACIVDIANGKNATDEDFKLMFESFASIWASRESKEYMELLLLQDVHSPNQFRVNAVLSSTDEFYQVYDINPWNKMWVSDEDRVMVW